MNSAGHQYDSSALVKVQKHSDQGGKRVGINLRCNSGLEDEKQKITVGTCGYSLNSQHAP